MFSLHPRLIPLAVGVAAVGTLAALLWPGLLESPGLLPDIVEQMVAAPAETEAQARSRVAQARVLCRDGHYEEGLVALASPAPNEVEIEASLALAWCASLNGEPSVASQAVQRALTHGDVSAEMKLLLAAAELALDHQDAAQAWAAEVAGASPLLAGYANLLRGEALKQLGRPEEAEPVFQLVTQQNTTRAGEYLAARSLGDAYRRAAEVAAASGWYAVALALAPDRFAEAELHVLLGGVALEVGKMPAALAEWRLVLSQFFRLTPATEALALLDMHARGTVDDFQRGLVLFYADRNAEAAQSFAAYLGSPRAAGDEAQARFFRGLALRDTGDTHAALAELEALVARFPADALADDALWQQGLILDGMGDARTPTLYARLVTAYPTSEFAGLARFRLALARYRAGAVDEALRQWEQLALSNAPSDERQRAWFWTLKGALALDQRERAASAQGTLAALAPRGYYAQRGAQLLAGSGFWPTATAYRRLAATPVSGEALSEWVASWSAQSPSTGEPPPLRVQRALALLAAAQRAQAEQEVQAWLRERPGPFELAHAAAALHEAGLPAAALRVASQLANLAPSWASASSPLESLLYPTAYLTLVDEEALRYNLDPRLLLALVRQESLFDPVAGSPAGALGLTQVIPPTGRDIAGGLRVSDFQIEYLYRPATSLRFGVYYLSEMLRQFEGDLVVALSAYNGGPGSAARWRGALPSYDPDLYIERIDFSETRRYVQLVLEHYARYLALYPAGDS